MKLKKPDMKIYWVLIMLFAGILFLVLLPECKKESTATIPTVSTDDPINIGPTSATFGVRLISNGGSPVITMGICFGTSQNPTVYGFLYSINYIGTNHYSTIIQLNPGTTYYFRGYATNWVGTAYGNQITFTTE